MLVWLGIGLILAVATMVAPLRWAAAITAFCLPMAGTAVFNFGSEYVVLPLVICFGFIARYCFTLFIRRRRQEAVKLAEQDLPLILYGVYCALSGILYPRVFAGETLVLTQRGEIQFLGPGSSSVVQIVYLVIAIMVYFALRHAFLRCGTKWIVYTIAAQSLFLGGMGTIEAFAGLAGVSMDYSWILNNKGYALLEQGAGTFVRVNSAFTEPSAFAAYLLAPLAFCYSLFVNGVKPNLMLFLTGLWALTLILCTSSSGYLGLLMLAAYAVLHSSLDPDPRRRDRGLIVVVLGGIFVAACVGVVMAAEAGILADLRQVILEMTIYKSQSQSGVERGEWAAMAVENGVDTHYLGAGYGALRTSGLLFGIFGMTGVIGLILFLIVMFRWLSVAFQRPHDEDSKIMAAASFAIFPMLGALIASASEIGLANMLWVLAATATAPIELRKRLINNARKQHRRQEAVAVAARYLKP